MAANSFRNYVREVQIPAHVPDKVARLMHVVNIGIASSVLVNESNIEGHMATLTGAGVVSLADTARDAEDYIIACTTLAGYIERYPQLLGMFADLAIVPQPIVKVLLQFAQRGIMTAQIVRHLSGFESAAACAESTVTLDEAVAKLTDQHDKVLQPKFEQLCDNVRIVQVAADRLQRLTGCSDACCCDDSEGSSREVIYCNDSSCEENTDSGMSDYEDYWSDHEDYWSDHEDAGEGSTCSQSTRELAHHANDDYWAAMTPRQWVLSFNIIGRSAEHMATTGRPTDDDVAQFNGYSETYMTLYAEADRDPSVLAAIEKCRAIITKCTKIAQAASK